MSRTHARSCCGRLPEAKETPLAEAHFDDVEKSILAIARYFFQSFAAPQSQGWMAALDLAEATFGDLDGPIIATRLLTTMRAVRYARRSVFSFNCQSCETCAAILTEQERRLIAALQAIRGGQIGRAQTELLMLCEGNDIKQVMGAMTRLSIALPSSKAARARAAYV
ncbi:hypothetical protein [Yoonia sp. 2307UL14-13]|uniref:hypothetical protein n=1 Tax=Yoonia sp. 2307UL14-13 TaxID=3126506 RepID=UPI0030AB37D8